MWNKAIILSSVGLLALVGCGGGNANATTETYVSSEVLLPNNNTEAAQFGQDYNGDGEVDGKDNSLAGLVGALAPLGVDLNASLASAVTSGSLLIGMDVSFDDVANDESVNVDGYLADLASGGAPLFDGSDALVPQGEPLTFVDAKIAGGVLSTGRSTFLIPLPLDPNSPTVLTLENAILTGTISADGIASGTLSGTVQATNLAENLNGIGGLVANVVAESASEFNNGGAPVACDSNGGASATCDAIGANGFCTDRNGDGTAEGFCVATGSQAEGLLNNGILDIDANQNGVVEVSFDAAAGTFSVNEIAPLFDIPSAGAAPTGLLAGVLFKLDLDGNGTIDSAGMGIGFTGVGATR